MQLFQFLGATIGASVVVILASLLWPKVMSVPRPEALTKVREVIMGTQPGQNIAQVLGVIDETNATPINLGAVVTSGTNAVLDTVTKSAQHAVATRLLESLAGQFNQLPEEDKASFREQICKPSEP